jgi:hypothetical protein
MFVENRLMGLLVIIINAAILLILESRAKSGKILQLRLLPALEAISEGIGRSVEMGGGVHYSIGEGLLTNYWGPGLVAGLSVLRYVASVSAELGARLIVTLNQSDTIPLATDILTTEYQIKGRSEDLDLEYSLRYLSDNDYAWASGCWDIWEKENCTTNLLIGNFSAMALPMVSVAFQRGMFQVGGTWSAAQLPWFAVCCDYAVLGEDLFAAGAYLSKDPVQTSNLVSQDGIKLIAIVIILIGIIASALGMEQMLKNLLLR